MALPVTLCACEPAQAMAQAASQQTFEDWRAQWESKLQARLNEEPLRQVKQYRLL